MRNWILATATLVTTAAAAQTRPAQPSIQEFALDAGHTIIEFSVGFAVTHVKGRFTQPHGTILYNAAHPDSSSVTLIIDAKSIDTGWPHRDDHLKTSDFFDVENFPTITFQSDRIERRGANWILSGPFTMHGVTKRISFPFRLLQEPGGSPGESHANLNAEGSLKIARKDFGILGGSKYNSWFDAIRSATVSDTVDISLEVSGWRPNVGAPPSAGIQGAVDRIKTEGVASTLDRFRQVKATKTPAEFASYFLGGDLTVRALIADKRTADAVALSRGLAELFPQNASAFLVHGFALACTGDFAGAEKQYAQAKAAYVAPVRDPSEKFPQDDENWYRADELARTALEWGRAREAVGLARVVSEIYPGNARSHVTYGLALARSGDSKGAAAAYAKALSIDPNETRAMEWKRRLNN